jgi:hypothetical protein
MVDVSDNEVEAEKEVKPVVKPKETKKSKASPPTPKTKQGSITNFFTKK